MKWHMHRYTKWSEPFSVRVGFTFTTRVGYETRQKRHCSMCNKIQERVIDE